MRENDLAAFFGSSGAISLFCTIDPVGSHFDELAAANTASRERVLTRLEEAIELDLIVRDQIGNRVYWRPTEHGMQAIEEIRASGLSQKFDEYRRAKRSYESESDAFAEYAGTAAGREAIYGDDG